MGFLLSAVVVLVALGYLVGSRSDWGSRPAGIVTMALLAPIVPFVMVRWMPGVAQPAQHPIPGGAPVVVSAAPDGTWDLYLLPDGDAANRVALTNSPMIQERFPQLSPDGSRIAYGVLQADGTYDLYMMELDGTRPTSNDPLLTGPGNLTDTSWSPDGRSLLVRSSTARGGRIFLLDLATGSFELFAGNASNPEWSPDGSQVAFVSYRREDPGNADIFVANADGSEARAVIDTGSDDYFPSWAPDGTSITFTSRAHGGDEDVFVADVSGEGLRNLTVDSSHSDETLGWTRADTSCSSRTVPERAERSCTSWIPTAPTSGSS
jgi:Tol biopolymer transport system component